MIKILTITLSFFLAANLLTSEETVKTITNLVNKKLDSNETSKTDTNKLELLGNDKKERSISSSIRLINLKNRESLCPNDIFEIKWEGVNPDDTVRLEYSTDGGMNWILITNEAKGLSYQWTIPNTPSENCIVRVIAKVEEKLEITNIIPDKAYIGDIIMLEGSGFGQSRANSIVSFAGVDAIEYITWNHNEIKVKVPIGANSGKVYTKVNGQMSNEVDFYLLDYELIDTVHICNRVWMIKNLSVKNYRNGDPIRYAPTEEEWINAEKNKEGAWCYYNSDEKNIKTFGLLYNWFAVNDPRGLAPNGWHIPSDAEWMSLINCLGNLSIDGGKLKSVGTLEDGDGLWHSPNLGATNESGFSAHPAGFRFSGGFGFRDMGYGGYWWSSTEVSTTEAWCWFLLYDSKKFYHEPTFKPKGLSVRCIKN